MTTSRRLLLGIENALPLRPAHAKNTNRSTRWTIPPASTLSPMPVTACAEGTPAFCRYRTLRAMPPTLAGVTRLTKDEASWARTVGAQRQPFGDAARHADARRYVREA